MRLVKDLSQRRGVNEAVVETLGLRVEMRAYDKKRR